MANANTLTAAELELRQDREREAEQLSHDQLAARYPWIMAYGRMLGSNRGYSIWQCRDAVAEGAQRGAYRRKANGDWSDIRDMSDARLRELSLYV